MRTATIDICAFILVGGVFSGARGMMGRSVAAPIERPLIRRDPLTGLPDRDALYKKLQQEWQRERRLAEPTALLLIEVDALSRQEGAQDRATFALTMQTVAGVLRRGMPRRTDLLVRYDHATFAVLLPSTGLPGSLRVAARLRWAVVQLGSEDWGLRQSSWTVTMGVAVQQGLVNGSSTTLMRAAEINLQKARRRGPDSLEHILIEGRDQVNTESAPLRRLPALQGRPEKRERSLQGMHAENSGRSGA
jgi:diguanylate cyclase (GGDEF)-like protein